MPVSFLLSFHSSPSCLLLIVMYVFDGHAYVSLPVERNDYFKLSSTVNSLHAFYWIPSSYFSRFRQTQVIPKLLKDTNARVTVNV